MLDLLNQGKLSAFHRQLVLEEEDAAFKSAGYQDWIGDVMDFMGERGPAFIRQINEMKRQKLVELRPDLEAALTQSIEYRENFPAPTLTPQLEKPGAALAAYMELLNYIDRKRGKGEIKREEAYAAYNPAFRLFADEGISIDHLNNDTDKIAIIKAKNAIEQKLLELRPDLSDEIRNLKAGQSR